MKMKDVIPIAISLIALFLSIVTSVHDWKKESQAESLKDASDIYNAYQLGQSAAVVYAYQKASKPQVANGQSQDQTADVQGSLWTFKAEGYAEYFKLTRERFEAFLKQVKGSDPKDVATTFEELDSTLQVASGHKAVAAYDLGWQTTILGLESAANANSEIVADYSTARDQLNRDLKEIGVKYTFPPSIADREQFVSAVKESKTILGKLQP